MVYPDSIVATDWPRVRAQCALMGVQFDAWQEGVGAIAFGLDARGRYAATVGGVFLSIPRQVGKTFFVGMVLVAMCVLKPGTTALWTAHRTRTASKTFDSLKGLVRRKRVWPFVESIRSANGQQEIRFTNGSVIMFGAREDGFGRGFDQVDVEVFDEAQILTEKALEDMIPAANQSQQATGALVFYMGTPPRPTDRGEVFRSRRDEALSGESEGMVWVEMSADPDVDPSTWGRTPDWEQVAKANPSYPRRTNRDAILRMLKSLPSAASVRREALGVWDEVTGTRLIPKAKWDALAVDAGAAPLDGVVAYGVRIAGGQACLAVCITPEGGIPHVEAIEVRDLSDGVEWLADWLAARRNLVVVDGREAGDLLVTALRGLRYPPRLILQPNVAQVIDAHAEMLNAVSTGKLTHLNQAALNEATANATKRKIGTAGGWGWLSLDPGATVLPLEAVTLAHYGATIAARRATRTGRRVVVYD